MLRLFVSIELPDEIKGVMEKLLDESRKQDSESRLRWARLSSFHVTLQFLGNVEEATVGDLSTAIGEATGTASAMTFSLGRLGTFGGKAPRVLWVGLQGDLDPLSDLVHAIGVGLTPLGFAPEKRRHSPHITLARVSRKPRRSDHVLLGKIACGTALPEASPFDVPEIRLMRSELHPSGSRYHTVRRFPLAAT